MADEPEVQGQLEEAAVTDVVVEEPEDLGDDINLLELQNLQDPATMGDDESAEDEGEEPPKPSTAAERKRLREMEAEDADLAAELAERDNRVRQEASAIAAQTERQRIQQAQYAKQVQDFEQARQNQLAYRQEEDAYLYALGETDVIKERAEREERMGRRAYEDQAWAAWETEKNGAQQQQQHYDNVRVGEQKVFMSAMNRAAIAKVPKEVIDALYAQKWPSDMGVGTEAYLSATFEALIEHGKKLGRAETSTERERERRRTAAAVGLNEPRPDTNATTRSTPRSGPSITEIDSWSYEKRMAELAKDPDLYTKAELAASRSAARRR